MGELAKKLQTVPYHTVLDAGCGTGLAGRFLRPLMDPKEGFMVGVDASQKMLDIAAKCTTATGHFTTTKKVVVRNHKTIDSSGKRTLNEFQAQIQDNLGSCDFTLGQDHLTKHGICLCFDTCTC